MTDREYCTITEGGELKSMNAVAIFFVAPSIGVHVSLNHGVWASRHFFRNAGLNFASVRDIVRLHHICAPCMSRTHVFCGFWTKSCPVAPDDLLQQWYHCVQKQKPIHLMILFCPSGGVLSSGESIQLAEEGFTKTEPVLCIRTPSSYTAGLITRGPLHREVTISEEFVQVQPTLTCSFLSLESVFQMVRSFKLLLLQNILWGTFAELLSFKVWSAVQGCRFELRFLHPTNWFWVVCWRRFLPKSTSHERGKKFTIFQAHVRFPSTRRWPH